jgi:hydroxypyruvate reductase
MVVFGAGKAAASMARAVEDHWPGPLSGLAATPRGHGVDCERIQVLEADHPVPDAAGYNAAKRILDLATGLEEHDLALCLISGGGSAVLSLPVPGVSLEAKRAINESLLRSGARISEINCVRKHLSLIKGGRLAAACWPARVVTLIVSDAPGDDPSVVASGPTVPDPTSVDQARQILLEYEIDTPPEIAAHLVRDDDETPKPGDHRLAGSEVTVVATARDALAAAAAASTDAGVSPIILGDRIEGEARKVAMDHCEVVRQVVRRGQPARPPCVLLSGGETTVTVRGTGRGGRNAEYALALALALDRYPGVFGIACDTDGVDGTEDNAGVVLSPDTLDRASALGMGAETYLANNDAYTFFSALGDLVITGPTLTNVNDFRAILTPQDTPVESIRGGP